LVLEILASFTLQVSADIVLFWLSLSY